ncbi:DUF3850 domain-containing protein [Paenibacillus ehimensis]|uniref:DUF3850 domain-containing protein n=1 Tax=Paenibacillus ehimensis TaxID=79264 RepID=UPI00046EBA4C
MNRIHEVKTLPQYFEPAATGIKKFTIRKNDRNYQVGDTLRKREWDPNTGYTGRQVLFTITYMTDYAQQPGFVVMGIELRREPMEGGKYTPEQITELLEEIQTAREAATPGPWRIFEGRIFGYSATSIDPLVHEFDTGSYRDAGNARLIANSPTWLQQLADIVQQQTQELSEAWKAYDNLKAEMEALGAEMDRIKASQETE